MKKLNYHRLVQVMDLDPIMGTIMRKGSSKPAGTIQRYQCIMIDGERFKGHHLMWFFVYNKWPEDEIDHINHNKLDNRIENLREATNSQNKMNRKRQRNSTSGYKGVVYSKRWKCWRARIGVAKTRLHLGSFKTPEEAYRTYCSAIQKYHGEFARGS